MHASTHSVMFHHFHNSFHHPGQGSISAEDFRRMVLWLKEKYTLLGAREYSEKALRGSLKGSDICLSFDDALRCQYDIAIPVLEDIKLDAFFFVYSSAFTEKPAFLEIYRYFRMTAFENVDAFYNVFFDAVRSIDTKTFSYHYARYKRLDYLAAFPFYTENDRWFRYIRDQYLDNQQYNEAMQTLMKRESFSIESAKQNLWMTEDDLKDVDQSGHIIGLHSFSHPTQMSALSKQKQKSEYTRNCQHLESLLRKPITSMSHPCGDYNQETLQVLSTIGIKIGFRSNMAIPKIPCLLEIPRNDHANVLREMEQ